MFEINVLRPKFLELNVYHSGIKCLNTLPEIVKDKDSVSGVQSDATS